MKSRVLFALVLFFSTGCASRQRITITNACLERQPRYFQHKVEFGVNWQDLVQGDKDKPPSQSEPLVVEIVNAGNCQVLVLKHGLSKWSPAEIRGIVIVYLNLPFNFRGYIYLPFLKDCRDRGSVLKAVKKQLRVAHVEYVNE